MKKALLVAAAAIALQAPFVVAAAPNGFRGTVRNNVTRAAELNLLLHRAKTQRRPSRWGAVSKLISSVKNEQDMSMHKLGTMSLLTQKMPLLRTQKREIINLVRDKTRGLLPKRPPMPARGTIEVRHYTMQGFLEPDLQRLQQSGFTVTRTGGQIEARRGRIRVIVRETHQDILRDLKDPNVHMIVYNGHSQIGGTVEQALQQAALDPSPNRKLVALFQCVGTQTMPLLKARAPNVDVITSNTPLYVRETPALVQALYEGVHQGDGYHKLRRRMDKASWGKGRLVFPNQTATLQHVDFDLNGQLDAHQNGQIRALGLFERGSAKSLMSGVHFLRTMNPYYADQTPGAIFGAQQARTPVVAMGIAADNAGSGVTNIVDRRNGNQLSFEVALRPQHKRGSQELIGAASVFELQLHMQKQLVNQSGDRAKVRALAFAGEYLSLIPRDRNKAQKALDSLTAMHGLPKLSLWDVERAIAGDHVIGEQQVDRLAQVVERARRSSTNP
ncbi:MAG: hypothetical protein KC503_23790 [Myxococcales bacterium]|nr:hypothetical protein [Myxococcales bacterium]